MATHLNSNAFSKTGKVILIGITLLSISCLKDKSFKSYKLNEKILFKINTGLSDPSGLLINNETDKFVYKISSNQLIFYHIKVDSVVKKIDLPHFVKFHSIDIIDLNTFALFVDSAFYVYKNNNFINYSINQFDTSIILLPYHKIKYFPDLNKITAIAIFKTKLKQDIKAYDVKFINVFDLVKKTSELVSFKYPIQYHDNKLGIPNIYFSKAKHNLIISFSYDPQLYILNLENLKVNNVVLKSRDNMLNASYDRNLDKRSKLDMIQKNLHFSDYYGIAFYGSNGDNFYRIYKPALPEKDGANFLSSKDIGCRLIKLSLKNGNQQEYLLPNGVYYLIDNWTIDPENEDLNYLKIYPYDQKNNIWIFNVHTIHLFDF